MDNADGAYGAGKAQGFGFTFDPLEFLKRPTTILRLVSWFFAVIVFGCISSGGYVEQLCIMKGDKNACGFGIFVGVFAFIACILFLLGDVLFEKLSSVQHRKFLVLGDLGFSAAWAFLYFVAFCYLTNKWTTTSQEFIEFNDVQPWQASNVRASIAFSFFSIASFGAIAFFAFQKFRMGAQGAFQTSDQIESQIAGADGGGPNSAGGVVGGGVGGVGGVGGAPGVGGGGFQQAPFGAGGGGGDFGGGGQFQSLTY